VATINDKQLVNRIIAARGRLYDDEPPAIKVVEYTNAWGKRTWGVVFADDSDPDRYERETQYVRDPRVIFQEGERGNGQG